MSRLDALVAPLTDAVMDLCPTGGTLADADAARERVQEALCAALRAVPKPNVAPDRLDPDRLREDATALVTGSSSPQSLVRTITDLLRQVREADQREEWIRQGYTDRTARQRRYATCHVCGATVWVRYSDGCLRVHSEGRGDSLGYVSKRCAGSGTQAQQEDEHRTTVTTRGDYAEGTLTWGWRCTCGARGEPTYGTATGAQEAADTHLAVP